jgi:RNA polymerase sigma factor (sigma-70 family)
MYSVAVRSTTHGAISSRPEQDAGANWSARDDNARFASVVMPHIDAAYSLAHWLTGNRADAEDVVQDASLRAFRAIRGFAGGSARAWVLCIVRNTAYSWLRKNRRATVVTVEELEEVEAAHAKRGDRDAETPEAALIAKIEAEHLRAAPTRKNARTIAPVMRGRSSSTQCWMPRVCLSSGIASGSTARARHAAVTSKFGISSAGARCRRSTTIEADCLLSVWL